MSDGKALHSNVGLRERFINALTATIELFEETGSEHDKRLKQLEDAVVRLNGEIHELQRLHRQLQQDFKEATFEAGRQREDMKQHARWLHEIIQKYLPVTDDSLK